MILVCGGQLDPNIGALLRRILARKIEFADLLVGPDLLPALQFDLESGTLSLDGRSLAPSACFVRHDVFGQQAPRPVSPASALGWFYALRGWALSNRQVRCFNRSSPSGEGSKLQNLVEARKAGFSIPETVVSNSPALSNAQYDWIRKPVGGGEYTLPFDTRSKSGKMEHPAIFLRRMLRPELRVYLVGTRMFGFSIESESIDYRNSNRVDIRETDPGEVESGLRSLCAALSLDFAAADFMRHPETGALVFLEINTQPMFVAFDKITEGRISDAIIDALLDGKTNDT